MGGHGLFRRGPGGLFRHFGDVVDLGLPAGAEVGPFVVGESVCLDREGHLVTVQEALDEDVVSGAAAAVEDQVDGRGLAGIGLQLFEGGNILCQGCDGTKDCQEAGKETFHRKRVFGLTGRRFYNSSSKASYTFWIGKPTTLK